MERCKVAVRKSVVDLGVCVCVCAKRAKRCTLTINDGLGKSLNIVSCFSSSSLSKKNTAFSIISVGNIMTPMNLYFGACFHPPPFEEGKEILDCREG